MKGLPFFYTEPLNFLEFHRRGKGGKGGGRLDDPDCENVKGLCNKKKKNRNGEGWGGGGGLEVKRAKELKLVVADKKGKKKRVKGT